MNHKLIIRALSAVSFVIGLMFAASFCAQCIMQINRVYLTKWGICFGIAMLIATVLFYISKGFKKNIFRREIFAILGLGWIMIVTVGMLPYLVLVKNCSLANAFFESVSGFTTTGSSVFDDLRVLPRSLLFYRSLTQCVGGFGTIFFFAILMPIFGAKAKSLCMSGLSVRPEETIFASTTTIIKYVLGIYAALIVVSAATFFFCGMCKLDALCYAFSVASTGGFTTPGGEKCFLSSQISQYFSIFIMILSGTNFVSLMKIIKGDTEELRTNEELRWYVIILLATFIVVAVATTCCGRLSVAYLKNSLFNVTSIVTSTGLYLSDFPSHLIFLQITFLIIMFFGGCTGSTTGGLKIARIVLVFKSCFKNLKLSFRPNALVPIFLHKKQVQVSDENETLSFLLSIFGILAFAIALLSATLPETNFRDIVFSVCESLLNTGINNIDLGIGLSYSEMTSLPKYLCSALMILGRVEIYAISALVLPSFWKDFS